MTPAALHHLAVKLGEFHDEHGATLERRQLIRTVQAVVEAVALVEETAA